MNNLSRVEQLKTRKASEKKVWFHVEIIKYFDAKIFTWVDQRDISLFSS